VRAGRSHAPARSKKKFGEAASNKTSVCSPLARAGVTGTLFALTLSGLAVIATGDAATPSPAAQCRLTPGDGGDPFYVPNTPVRSHVGTGFTLSGIVRSGIDCSVIKGARVEFWLRRPDGQYDDAHRGTVITDANGRFRFESNFPGGGGGFQPHIHLRVAVPGFRTLVTVYLPDAGATTGVLELVLEPEV
jgi:hypothetical protein